MGPLVRVPGHWSLVPDPRSRVPGPSVTERIDACGPGPKATQHPGDQDKNARGRKDVRRRDAKREPEMGARRKDLGTEDGAGRRTGIADQGPGTYRSHRTPIRAVRGSPIVLTGVRPTSCS